MCHRYLLWLIPKASLWEASQLWLWYGMTAKRTNTLPGAPTSLVAYLCSRGWDCLHPNIRCIYNFLLKQYVLTIWFLYITTMAGTLITCMWIVWSIWLISVGKQAYPLTLPLYHVCSHHTSDLVQEAQSTVQQPVSPMRPATDWLVTKIGCWWGRSGMGLG